MKPSILKSALRKISFSEWCLGRSKQQREWYGFLTPSEAIALVEDGWILANDENGSQESYLRECIKTGKSYLTTTYFSREGKTPLPAPPPKRHVRS